MYMYYIWNLLALCGCFVKILGADTLSRDSRWSSKEIARRDWLCISAAFSARWRCLICLMYAVHRCTPSSFLYLARQGKIRGEFSQERHHAHWKRNIPFWSPFLIPFEDVGTNSNLHLGWKWSNEVILASALSILASSQILKSLKKLTCSVPKVCSANELRWMTRWVAWPFNLFFRAWQQSIFIKNPVILPMLSIFLTVVIFHIQHWFLSFSLCISCISRNDNSAKDSFFVYIAQTQPVLSPSRFQQTTPAILQWWHYEIKINRKIIQDEQMWSFIRRILPSSWMTCCQSFWAKMGNSHDQV